MHNIECKCCSGNIRVGDYDFARFSKGEMIFCEICYDDLKNNKTKCSRS